MENENDTVSRLAHAFGITDLEHEARQEVLRKIHAEELEEACAFFSDFAKDCPTTDAGCSTEQSSFSKQAWR